MTEKHFLYITILLFIFVCFWFINNYKGIGIWRDFFLDKEFIFMDLSFWIKILGGFRIFYFVLASFFKTQKVCLLFIIRYIILKEINPEYSLKGLMLKLKLQHFGQVMQRANSLEKTLMLEKTESKTRRRQQRMRWLDNTINTVDMNLSKHREVVKDRGAWCAAVLGFPKSPTRQWLNNKDNFIKSVFCCQSPYEIVCHLVDNLNTA